MFNYLVLKDGSVTAFVVPRYIPVGLEKYYVSLICSQEKHLHFQENSQEKSGKTIKQDMYGPCVQCSVILLRDDNKVMKV